MDWLVACLTLAAAYFVGAIPFGYLVARSCGIDIFQQGSGNIGATNIGRVLGRKFGILVFVLDFAKGAGPVGLALVLKPHFSGEVWTGGFVEVGAGLFAFLGHLLPVYLKFRGGKGVATGAGAVAVLMPIAALAALCVWLVVVIATRYVSLASMAAVIVLCAVQFQQPASRHWLEPRTWFCLVAGGLVLVRHRGNIVRLVKGTENQLKENPVMFQASKCLHVLALGMWFGMAVFFSFVVGFSLFGAFEAEASADKRESWFPRPAMYREVKDDVKLSREQGTRAAGYAIGPMFVWYFALQGVCGFMALATALPWMTLAPVHRWRVHLLLAAIALVLIGWPLERQVHALRDPRNETTEAYLRDRGNESKLTAMTEARAEFAGWHLASVFVNLATIICVTGAMALAGNLPSNPDSFSARAAPGGR
jgi:acyl-phosphate glycerol 3-phosphate acyltransferase